MASRYEKTKITKVMVSLAHSEKLALDTLKRAKAKTIRASFSSDTSKAKYGNDKVEDVSIESEDSVKDKAVGRRTLKHWRDKTQKKESVGVLVSGNLLASFSSDTSKAKYGNDKVEDVSIESEDSVKDKAVGRRTLKHWRDKTQKKESVGVLVSGNLLASFSSDTSKAKYGNDKVEDVSIESEDSVKDKAVGRRTLKHWRDKTQKKESVGVLVSGNLPASFSSDTSKAKYGNDKVEDVSIESEDSVKDKAVGRRTLKHWRDKTQKKKSVGVLVSGNLPASFSSDTSKAKYGNDKVEDVSIESEDSVKDKAVGRRTLKHWRDKTQKKESVGVLVSGNLPASFSSDKSKAKYGNDDGEEFSIRLKDSVKDKAIIRKPKHWLDKETKKKGFVGVLSQPVANIDSSVCLDRSLKLFEYYMDRISFQCECHWNNLPPTAMTKADKLHCQRFHKGALPKSHA